MTAQLSREIVENLLQHNDESDSPANAEAWEVNALCRLALAGMDKEPVYQLFDSGYYDTDRETYQNATQAGVKGRILYAAPPAPAPVAVPDEMPESAYEILSKAMGAKACFIADDLWNSCRAAMIKAGPVTGWIKCSERMPDAGSEQRVCAYTPSPHIDVRFRMVKASMFKQVCCDATHWQYMAAPEQEV